MPPLSPILAKIAKRLRKPHGSNPPLAQEEDDPKHLEEHLTLNPHAHLQIFMLGAPNTGKRSLCERFTLGIFPLERDPFEDCTFRHKIQLQAREPQHPPRDGVSSAAEPKHLVLVEWTTSLGIHHETSPALMRWSVRRDDAHVLVYNVSSRASFDAVEVLWRDFVAVDSADKVLFLLANGIDAPAQAGDAGADKALFILPGYAVNGLSPVLGPRIVSEREGRELAERMGAGFREVSAKTGEGCGEELVSAMARKILLRRIRTQRDQEPRQV